MNEQLASLPGHLSAHLRLVLLALALGIVASVPLGVLAARRPALGRPVLALASVVQTVPSLALLALMVPLFAWAGLSSIGFWPALVALVLYSALPILRNTVAGLDGIDPVLREAAVALGMTPGQRLWRVELPLALPTVLAGVRIAAAWSVGVATLATPVGAKSLGNYIFGGLQMRDHASILVGCVGAAAIALVLDGLVHAVEQAHARRSRSLGIVAALLWACLVALAVVPLRDSPAPEPPVRIGAKTFTEQYLLAELLEERVESTTGTRCEVLPSLGSTVAFDALKAGDIDAYVDYTGTIWATVLHRADNPGREVIASEVRARLEAEFDVHVVARLGFENTYALATPRPVAETHGLATISDLVAAAPELSIAGDYEFFARPEWAAVRDGYGLSFGDQRSMDAALMYEAARNASVDVISAFSTDGRLAAYDLVILHDDRRVIPPYDAILLASGRLLRERPEVARALRAFEGQVDDNTMRAMNAAVDVDGRSVGAVAREFLGATRSPR